MKKSANMMLLLAILGLTACAAKYPPPDSQISVATSSITQAESVGAFETAPVELRAAKDKLAQARQAMLQKDNLAAQRLAEEATVDANLAQAKARAFKSRKTAEEIKASIRTLQEEIDRKSLR
jgi:hypothetical protein